MIEIGDMILMEYAQNVVETVIVTAIHDVIVYGVGSDGESYCAPPSHCDKIPY